MALILILVIINRLIYIIIRLAVIKVYDQKIE